MQQQRPHGKNLRRGRVSLPGQIYAITTVCRNRRPFLADFHTARLVIRILREHQEHGYATTLCFVVMPDHLHWLMALGEERDLSSVIRGVKALASKRSGHRLWQPGFYDHALRKDVDVKGVARYLVANPLRKGLVTQINDYPHWDAIWL